jgi:hypothetical protein
MSCLVARENIRTQLTRELRGYTEKSRAIEFTVLFGKEDRGSGFGCREGREVKIDGSGFLNRKLLYLFRLYFAHSATFSHSVSLFFCLSDLTVSFVLSLSLSLT